MGPAYKILVVDDSRTQLDWPVAVLEKEGYAVRTAADGKDAIRKVRTESPDLVLLDMILPDMDGLDMLAEIRAFGQGICIVEQIPTKIVAEAVKNTNLKIMLRLTSKDDRDFLGEAMNFNEEQKRFVTNLKPGQFVAFEQNVDQPLLLTLPDPSQWPDLFPRPEGNRPARGESYTAMMIRDGADASSVRIEHVSVRSTESISLDLRSGGGFVAKFEK